MGHEIKIGIVGLGAAGTQAAQAIRKSPHFRLAAGADNDAGTWRKYGESGNLELYSTLEEMCRKSDIDAVYVATPNRFHAEHTVMALQYGKHVMVEKPMAMDLEECDRMIAAAERHGVKLMVVHTRSFNPPIRKMREMISGGEWGQVIQMTTLHYSPWLLRPRMKSELDTKSGGGVCYRQAPHQVDIVRLLGGGKVRSVRALTGRWDPRHDTEGNYSSLLTFENGASANLIYNGYGFFDASELTFGIGSEGRERQAGAGNRLRDLLVHGATKEAARSGMVNAVETGTDQSEETKQPFFGLTIVSCEQGDLRQYPDGIRIYDADGVRDIPCPPWEGPLAVELRDFYDSVAYDRKVPHDGAWGKATLEVCLAIIQSSREQKEIELRCQVESPY